MLKTYLEISLGMSVVILLALLFTPFLKKRYRAGARYAIWIICALALLAPFKPSPKITIEIPQIKHEDAARVTLTDDVTYAVTETEEAADAADANTKTETAYVQPSDAETSEPIDVWAVLTAAWLFGAAAFMIYYIVGYAVFLKKIRPWCREFEFSGYREKPRLVYCRLVKSPMLTGFFKPSILLPRNDYSDTELSMILKHELTHYKRGDLWAKLLFTAVNAVHWYNPVVYVMRKTANRDMEYSCDERVVKGMDRQFCQDYSIAILRCAAGVGMCTAFSTHFSEDKEKLRQRLRNILSGSKKRGIIIGAIALVLAVVCAGVFGFGNATEEEENYLFIGLDGREHIDTIMFAEVGKDGIAVTSIPNDTMFLSEFTGKFMPDTVEKLLKIMPVLTGKGVNKYVVADINDALELLSEIDGVKFEIPDLYGDGEGMVYDDPYQDLHINLPVGEHELTNEEMLQVMRYRKSNMKSDGYNMYDEGDLDRIKMTHSLLEQLITQKKNILLSDEFFEAALSAKRSAVTNIGTDDIRKILKAANSGNVTFTLLKGCYSKDVGNYAVFYGPNVIYEQYGIFAPNYYDKENSIISAVDTTELLCEVVSLTIDGEEHISDVKDNFGIWYNERKGEFHMCVVPELKDGTSIVIQPFEPFALDGYSAHGTAKWSRQIRNGEAALRVISNEYIDCTITGLDTENPVFRSDDGRYEVKFKVVEE